MLLALLLLGACAREGDAVRIGSKTFTESVILSNIVADLAAASGARVIRRPALGGTRLVWNALLSGEIDAYPEYTGTLRQEILAELRLANDRQLADALGELGLRMSLPLGFGNGYALGMRRDKAEALGVRDISDLARHPSLVFGLSEELLARADGWPALRAAYGLAAEDVRGLDHDIAYKGLIEGAIDVVDLYATDPQIADRRILVLIDDRKLFAENRAVLLYRADLEQRAPRAVMSMLRLEGRIDAPAMIAMNVAVRTGLRTEREAAANFVATQFGVEAPAPSQSLAERLWRRTREHLFLVGVSLAAAILVAVPLGVAAAKRPRLGHAILGLASVLQTIPSLALLVFMIPLLGIGAPPAIVALFLYSLLPIVRNVATGLTTIPRAIENSAIAIGLSPWRRLLLVELPMASPAILAGLKTAAVINVGTATLGALIGAGGYGQPIFTGVRLDNFALILEGAIPAALMALAVQGLFDLAESWIVPRGLRLKASG
ncbi:ABC transporter permease subunit [Methylosinus sporium]|uniref:ABC transporter permease subunit n=1 Tax=Methylosinus sporium TaxID=428 RepID=A0A549T714_METSR|nr:MULTISPECIES: glycine betaine ABC transporter substrate-binding protein [Methylosinus]MBU3888267.1 ABC transporter permease subunit [Methylosinus sp. KRF6]TRL37671.1 ABC transporter permease subunit [Methylosinus sporium]